MGVALSGESDSMKVWRILGYVGTVLAIMAFFGYATLEDLIGSSNGTPDDGPTTTGQYEAPDDSIDDDPIYDDPINDDPDPEEETTLEDDMVDARAGDCVWGANDDGAEWDVEACEVGNFLVLERIAGGDSSCGRWDRRWDYSRWVNDSEGSWDLLCLSMNWAQGDIAHAPVDTCLYQSGSAPSSLYYKFVSCPDANAIVTGYTHVYNDPGFCGSHGWASDRNSEFDLSYTVCVRAYSYY
ncbi:hypothetical protein FB566_3081 [Stackebrandtia endophytica]|uniref:Uncharacterized protein n=1 Tax=Stackebrandtia endophytica TaxID=1496996 RepID=A0A543AY65_9ACTN|nr:hypothetical protein [Stackebrandtia endophytica]TQL77522.1 hypothetical protein FB566_3081 [Stackebrandtia endophytica]